MKFVLQLALACGHASPIRMLRGMRPSELGLWAALWRTDPWGEERADLRSGMLSALIANVNRDGKKKPDPFLVTDFMPYRQETPGERARGLSARLRSGLKGLFSRKEAKTK